VLRKIKNKQTELVFGRNIDALLEGSIFLQRNTHFLFCFEFKPKFSKIKYVCVQIERYHFVRSKKGDIG